MTELEMPTRYPSPPELLDGSSSVQQILRGCDLFVDLTGGELRRLARRFEEVEIAANHSVTGVGGRLRDFCVVGDGAVVVAHDAIGQPVQPMVRLRRGDYFGELVLFGDARERPVARVTRTSRLARIDGHDFLMVLRADYPALHERLATEAARHRGNRSLSALQLGRRREVRIRFDHPVGLELADGDIHPARLSSLSLGGLSLELAPPAWKVKDEVLFGLGVGNDVLALEGRIVWRQHDRVGVSFVKSRPNHDTLIQMTTHLLLETAC